MPAPSCCDCLTPRGVLLKVSPLLARLISVPDDLSLEELHNVLQLVLGWSGQTLYNFRIHGQEIGRGRHLRTHLLREFQLRRREKFLYTYCFLDLWQWGFAFWISNRDRQKPGGPVAWEAGPRRHRKSAEVRAGTCGFRISTVLSAHSRAETGREGLAAHGGSFFSTDRNSSELGVSAGGFLAFLLEK